MEDIENLESIKDILKQKRLENLARGRETAARNRVEKGNLTKEIKTKKSMLKEKEHELVSNKLNKLESEIVKDQEKDQELLSRAEEEAMNEMIKDITPKRVNVDKKLKKVQVKPKKRYVYVQDSDSSSEEEIHIKRSKGRRNGRKHDYDYSDETPDKSLSSHPGALPLEPKPQRIEPIHYVNDQNDKQEEAEHKRLMAEAKIRRIQQICPGWRPNQ